MIHEIASLKIDPARAAEFEAAVASIRHRFDADPGCLSFALERVIELPDSYRLVVGWTSVEAHIVDFRKSAAFQEFRALVGPFFTEPPSMFHVEKVI